MSCPVCSGSCSLLGEVDFNKSCLAGKSLPDSGQLIQYLICDDCDFCFAPNLYQWSLEEFEKKIYNSDYGLVDPDYEKVRPLHHAKNVITVFGKGEGLRHLDYGGGNGLLSNTLFKSGWNSVSYDPFVDKDTSLSSLGQFDLITAIEVFEHVPKPHQLFQDLSSLMKDMVVFTTLLSDNHLFREEGVKWWYIAPRNGHISIWSKKSLEYMARKYGFNARSSNQGFHILFKKRLPEWAGRIQFS